MMTWSAGIYISAESQARGLHSRLRKHEYPTAPVSNQVPSDFGVWPLTRSEPARRRWYLHIR
jgi:hypothetical protein